MLAATNHSLEKLENLLKSAGYRIRYEKGNFKTGACLLQNSSVVVINKFSNLESKINSLTELIRGIDLDQQLTEEKQLVFYRQIKQTELQL